MTATLIFMIIVLKVMSECYLFQGMTATRTSFRRFSATWSECYLFQGMTATMVRAPCSGLRKSECYLFQGMTATFFLAAFPVR